MTSRTEPDIVERLRASHGRTGHEAADEIERLREALEQLIDVASRINGRDLVGLKPAIESARASRSTFRGR